MTATNKAVLAGGPRDGEVVDGGGAGLLEVEVDGLVHRYIPTTRARSVDGADLPVYNYDGAVNPAGAEDGVEDAEKRMASPLANEDG